MIVNMIWFWKMIVTHLELGKRRKINFFFTIYIEMYKRCTMEKPHELYFHIIRVVQDFLHVFHIIFRSFSCGNNANPSINIICVKRTQTLILPSLRCMLIHLKLGKL
jgi:hypothetical protein